MRIIDKIVSFIKKLFNKSEKVKEIEASNSNIKIKKKIDFIIEHKNDRVKQREAQKVETLICEGDGLGIQPKISY